MFHFGVSETRNKLGRQKMESINLVSRFRKCRNFQYLANQITGSSKFLIIYCVWFSTKFKICDNKIYIMIFQCVDPFIGRGTIYGHSDAP